VRRRETLGSGRSPQSSHGSEANEAAIKRYNEEHGTAIEIRQLKYLNNLTETWSMYG
jgi:transposase-like protein